MGVKNPRYNPKGRYRDGGASRSHRRITTYIRTAAYKDVTTPLDELRRISQDYAEGRYLPKKEQLK